MVPVLLSFILTHEKHSASAKDHRNDFFDFEILMFAFCPQCLCVHNVSDDDASVVT